MTRPRIALGLEASRPDLDGAVCADVGRQLADARRARGLTTKDVAASLLLAPVQVTALEDVHPEVFYGADFYATALRKYAALVGLDSELVSRVLVRPGARVSAPASFKRGRRALDLSLPAIPRPSMRLVVAVGLVITSAAGWLLISAVRHRTPPPLSLASSSQPDLALPQEPPPVSLETTPAQVTATAEPVTTLVPDAALLTTKLDEPQRLMLSSMPDVAAADETIGHIRVAKRTWIFVRYVDNTTVQRGLAPGEKFVLQDLPTYLAVGAAQDTAVVIGGRTLDNTPFTTNGQLRVGATQLARLSTQQQ